MTIFTLEATSPCSIGNAVKPVNLFLLNDLMAKSFYTCNQVYGKRKVKQNSRGGDGNVGKTIRLIAEDKKRT